METADNVAVITEFIAAWSRLDADELAGDELSEPSQGGWA